MDTSISMQKNLIKIIFLVVLIIGIWGLSWRFLLRSPKVKGVSTNVSPSHIVSLTNLKRIEAGLSALRPSSALDQAALAKAQDMFTKQYFNHLDPQGQGSWKFIQESGYEYYQAGENLARNFSTAEEVIKAWMNSPTHQQNMLNQNYQDIGVAVVESKGEVYIIQLMASPQPIGTTQAASQPGNFTYTSPLSGYSLFNNPSLALPLFSLAIAIFLVVIGFQAYKIFELSLHSLKKPDISHWEKT